MAYLRVLTGLIFCRIVFGKGPWDNLKREWERLYPINATRAEPASIAEGSVPLLPAICKAISNTKMRAFLRNSLNQILPWKNTSPDRIREFLSRDLSDFCVDKDKLMEYPILALASFRMIQIFGGRSNEWIMERIRSWLTSLCMSKREKS